jgi:HEAT repeat protein
MNRRRVAALLAWAVFLGFGTAPSARAQETAPDLLRRLNAGSTEERLDALRQVHQSGQAGRRDPALILPLCRAMGDEDVAVRRLAARAVGAQVVGLKAPPAELMTALTQALADSDVPTRDLAVQSFAELGPAGLPALRPLLAGKDDEQRAGAAAVVAKMAAYGMPVERDADILAGLTRGLSASNAEVRRNAARALCALASRLGQPSAVLLAALAGGLSDPDEEVRVHCSGALASLRQSALPVVLPLLRDPNPAVRIEAAEVLGRMGRLAGGCREAVPALREAARSDDPQLRQAAAEALRWADR